jgi:signal transduction histidine kinase
VALQERLRPRLREDLVVVAIGGVMLAVFLAQPDNDLAADQVPRSMDWLGVLLIGVGCVSLLACRRFPLSVVVLALALEVVWNSLGYTNGAINLPALVAFYALGTTGDRLRQAVALVLTVVPLVIAMVVDRQPWWWIVGNVGWPVAALLFGEVSRSRRMLLDRYQQRAERAEADQEAETQRRLAEERLRIARDLHDLLGHTVSLMTVQAGVAAAKLDRSPDSAREAIEHIREAGRQANNEIRATVQLLRSVDEPTLSPSPTIADVEQLSRGATRLGLTVACRIAPDALGVDALVGLTAYRIVQEALTNVVRHADATHVDVEIARTDWVLCCVVRDDGTTSATASHRGNGLRGMAERVALAGGELRAGPGRDGGFEVVATLPARRGGR